VNFANHNTYNLRISQTYGRSLPHPAVSKPLDPTHAHAPLPTLKINFAN